MKNENVNDITQLCENAWSKLEDRLAYGPVLDVLNRHDRGQVLKEWEIDLLEQFVNL